MTRMTQFFTCLICSAMTLGLVGVNSFQEDDAAASKDTATKKAERTRQLQPPSTQVADSPAEDLAAIAQPARLAEKLFKVYALKNLPASTAKRLLGGISDKSDQTRIEVDTDSNSIIASASREQHSKIAALLIETDQLSVTKAKDKTRNSKSDKHPPMFLPYARDAWPAEIWLHKMLQVPVPKLDFPGETPLSEILERIADYYTTTHGKPDGNKAFTFTILPDIPELELESIQSLEEVFIQDIALDGVTLENALQIILEQTDPSLTYEIRNEVIVVTTMAKAYDSFVTRVYEVGHLTGLKFQRRTYPMNGIGGGLGGGMGGAGFGGGGGQFSVQEGGGRLRGDSVTRKKKNMRNAKPPRKAESDTGYVGAETVQSLIVEMTSPPLRWESRDGEGGAIHPIGDILAIRQTQQGHRAIERLLNLLTESTSKIGQQQIAKDAHAETKPNQTGTHFLPYARDARPAEIWLHKMLQTPAPKLDFPGKTSLSQILEQITAYYTTTHEKSDSNKPFKLTILPDILELELESINSLEDVLIQDIDLHGVTLGNALQIIFEQTVPRLTYEIRNEVMFVTTMAKANDSFVTQVYDVEDLLAVEFERHFNPMNVLNKGGMGLGGGGFFSVQSGGQSAAGPSSSSRYRNNIGNQPLNDNSKKKRKRNGSRRSEPRTFCIQIGDLIQTIQTVTSPQIAWPETEGETGLINSIGSSLVILQTRNGQREVARILNLLTEATRASAE